MVENDQIEFINNKFLQEFQELINKYDNQKEINSHENDQKYSCINNICKKVMGLCKKKDAS